MIKNFRKIRQSMIKENRTSKYLLYAIGEIILVVIGILIALSINNWNQQKNNDAKITSILKEIQNDIVTDLKASNRIFDYHVRTDSISKAFLNNKYTAEDIKKSGFYRIGYNYRDFKIVTNGFDNLKGNIDNVPEKYADLLPEIKDLYVTLKTNIDVANDKIRSTVYKNIDDESNFDWYQDELKGIKNDAQIDYYLNDKNYKNLVGNYMSYRINIFALSNQYRVKTIDLYLKIQEVIGSTDDIPDSVSYTYKDTTFSKNYVGTYKLKETINTDIWDETVNITLKDGQLEFEPSESNFQINLLYYDKNTFFIDSYNAFFVFDRPKKTSFISLVVSTFLRFTRK
ncbi:hypothetical protein ES692_04930 [Psychroserpens burtonensis]|uniref:Uncharacterized protein n=2 Tax=Psychroserpens burtonensis TaxID=49278 RepID=A0A5C7B978_9FLAO|nr:hypothetical protein ES692_04930 [Psychroserpens burtonensis]